MAVSKNESKDKESICLPRKSKKQRLDKICICLREVKTEKEFFPHSNNNLFKKKKLFELK